MPIYEYRCPKCGVVEVIRGIKEAPLKKCPTCKSKVERMISSTSFVLKGTGWYATDYAKKPPPSESGKDGKEGTANGTSSDKDATASKTESEKPNTSTDSKSTASTEKPTTTKKAESTKPSTTKSTD